MVIKLETERGSTEWTAYADSDRDGLWAELASGYGVPDMPGLATLLKSAAQTVQKPPLAHLRKCDIRLGAHGNVGCRHPTVARRVHATSAQPSPTPAIPPIRLKKVEQGLRAGQSIRAVAKATGVSTATVQRVKQTMAKTVQPLQLSRVGCAKNLRENKSLFTPISLTGALEDVRRAIFNKPYHPVAHRARRRNRIARRM